jgi:hypothetical protein
MIYILQIIKYMFYFTLFNNVTSLLMIYYLLHCYTLILLFLLLFLVNQIGLYRKS